ncbi:MAG: hypothetical protein P1U36_00820, partial [Legionellaceae bacterium]|nr:hypothetical protein [Legionellaceae bacterium]
FGDALSAFSPENQPQFIEFIKYKIPDIIQSLDDVKDVLKHQNQQGQDLFLDAIKEHIPNIINNTEDFKQACRYYSPEFQIDFLQTKKQKLLEMITFTGGSRFGDALSAFSPENQPQFIELLKNNIPNISEDLTQLAYADAFENSIAALSPENQPQFIEFMKELLPHIIVIDRNEFINERMRSRTDLIHDMILSFHSEKNRTFFIEVISKLLPIIIQNTKDLQDVLDYLSTETQDQIVEAASTNEENRQKFYTMKDELNQMKDDDSGCYIMDDDDIFLPPF